MNLAVHLGTQRASWLRYVLINMCYAFSFYMNMSWTSHLFSITQKNKKQAGFYMNMSWTSHLCTPHLITWWVPLGYVLIIICSLPIQLCRYVRAWSYPLYHHEDTLNFLTPLLLSNVWASLLMVLFLQSVVNIHGGLLSIVLPTLYQFDCQ